jgi:hypothetical protein
VVCWVREKYEAEKEQKAFTVRREHGKRLLLAQKSFF